MTDERHEVQTLHLVDLEDLIGVQGADVVAAPAHLSGGLAALASSVVCLDGVPAPVRAVDLREQRTSAISRPDFNRKSAPTSATTR